MIRLKDMVGNSKVLANGLMENGMRHREYRTYTTVERALGIMQTGNLYLSNGFDWNDSRDGENVRGRGMYAKCFSCSTCENVAMWMLYGKMGGENCVCVTFSRAAICEVLKTAEIEIGHFAKGVFKKLHTLSRDEDFEIFITDVLYFEPKGERNYNLSVGEEHVSKDKAILKDDHIFTKHYAWHYEKETRLVIKLSNKWKKLVKEKETSVAKIVLSETAKKEIKNKDVIRSPIYAHSSRIGRRSKLEGTVTWDLRKQFEEEGDKK